MASHCHLLPWKTTEAFRAWSSPLPLQQAEDKPVASSICQRKTTVACVCISNDGEPLSNLFFLSIFYNITYKLHIVLRRQWGCFSSLEKEYWSYSKDDVVCVWLRSNLLEGPYHCMHLPVQQGWGTCSPQARFDPPVFPVWPVRLFPLNHTQLPHTRHNDVARKEQLIRSLKSVPSCAFTGARHNWCVGEVHLAPIVPSNCHLNFC